MTAIACPTPGKVNYLTRRYAKTARRDGTRRTDLRAYHCRCGFWHLGHLPDGWTRQKAQTVNKRAAAA